MKAMHLIIAMLVMMSLASCSADGNDPVENSVSTYLLEKTYGARSVTYEENNSDKLKLSELPAISLSEADHILSVLRKHTDAQEEGSPDKPGGLSIQLCKSEKKEFYIRYSS